MMMTRWKEEKKEGDAQCHRERHKHFYIIDFVLKIYLFIKDNIITVKIVI